VFEYMMREIEFTLRFSEIFLVPYMKKLANPIFTGFR